MRVFPIKVVLVEYGGEKWVEVVVKMKREINITMQALHL